MHLSRLSKINLLSNVIIALCALAVILLIIISMGLTSCLSTHKVSTKKTYSITIEKQVLDSYKVEKDTIKKDKSDTTQLQPINYVE